MAPALEFGNWMLAVWTWLPSMVVLGACFGSFINVLAYRLPLYADLQTALMVREFLRDSCKDLRPALWTESLHGPSDDLVLRDERVGSGFKRPGVAESVYGRDLKAHFVSADGSLARVSADSISLLRWISQRSRCTSCGALIHWWALIPILGYWLSGRHCARCAQPISARYMWVEVAVAVLWGLVSIKFGPGATALACAGFVTCLVALSLIDWDTKTLPDGLTLSLMWAGLLWHAAWAAEFVGGGAVSSVGFFEVSGWWSWLGLSQVSIWLPSESFALGADLRLAYSVCGAALGYLVLWGVNQTYRICTGQDGMGQGDFKLMAAAGAWLGVHWLPLLVLLSSVTGVALYALHKRIVGGELDLSSFEASHEVSREVSSEVFNGTHYPSEAGLQHQGAVSTDLSAGDQPANRETQSPHAAPFGPAIALAAILAILA